MKIRMDDYRDMLEYLVRKRREGEEFIAFRTDVCLSGKEGLFRFFDYDEARTFCREMSTDAIAYDCLAIRSAYRAMAEATARKDFTTGPDGIVDVSQLVKAYYMRLETERLTYNQNSKTMNMKNLEYLQDQVKYTGFGDDLANALKEQVEQGKPEFKLLHSVQYGNDTLSATLNFSQSKQSDMYFFNSYRASLQKEGTQQSLEQTFYINKGSNITLKEAYNLMEGRAVNKDLTNKEGQEYNAWVQLDFKQSDSNGNFKLKQYHENYGYDLGKAIEKHPIKELEREDYRSNLLESLKKGNLQSVTFKQDGQEVKQYVEASPRFKTVNVYDSAMQRLGSRQNSSQKQSESENQATRQDKKQSQTAGDEAPDIPATQKKKGRRKSQSV